MSWVSGIVPKVWQCWLMNGCSFWERAWWKWGYCVLLLNPGHINANKLKSLQQFEVFIVAVEEELRREIKREAFVISSF